MKVAILVPNFIDSDGGARVAELQAEELTQQGNEVAIFTLAADIQPENARLYVMGMPKRLFWQRVYRLLFPLDLFKVVKWLPRLKHFDLVIAHLYPLTWLAFWAKRIYKVKYAFWFHGLYEPGLFLYAYERFYIKVMIFMTRITTRNVDSAFSVSKFAQVKLKEYTGLDSEVIYNQVDSSKLHRGIDGSKIRQKYGLGDAPVILSVGRITPQKGGHLLLEAFNLVRQELPQVKLLMVGDFAFGYYVESLKKMADESVIFTGRISKEDMPYYYAMCDIYATCSLFENHNLPVLEAQACGKPVVAFDIEALREELGDNDVLVETGNIKKFAQACIDKLYQARKSVNKDDSTQ